jgi:pyruvate/2-oxoglutarate dehydrogenase complex dihydrolipoamide dehydrogenase (E3) component
MTEFDAIIIGAGQSGVPLSKTLAKAGWKTALIEKRLIGGTCINDGCTPTKTLIASARMAYLAGKSAELGIEIPAYQVNFEQIMERAALVVTEFREGATAVMEKTENLSLIYGHAKFLDNYSMEVESAEGKTEKYAAKYIFIDGGASPFIPDTPGLVHLNYLTSTSILELTSLPEHLLIIGGSYIALEYGQMFRRFGSRITILERTDRLLPREDDDVCETLTDMFTKAGIDVFTNASVLKYENIGEFSIMAIIERNGRQEHIHCTHVLVATGRQPQTQKLGLENTDIKLDGHGHIKVNEFLETDVEHVYALGDVKGGPAFTHVSYNDYIIVSKNLFEGTKLSTTDRKVPFCMFTDPQLGRIGMNELEAVESGVNFLIAKIPMENVARAIENSEPTGFMKAIVDKDSKQILGVTIIGEQAGETMTILQLAMSAKMTSDELSNMMFAHPLYAESINNLFLSLGK